MNDEAIFETGMFETDQMFGEATETANWGYEAPLAAGKVPHPQFGLVTPLTGEYGTFEQFGAGVVFEAPGSGGKVPHPQFGLVTPIGRGSETSEVFQGEEEVQFEALDEEIIGGDERFRVNGTTLVPWRWVCYLELRYPRFLATGSGLLISPRHILTCGHNLFDHSSNSPALAISATPGCNGVANRPFGRHAAASWRPSNEFRTTGNPRFDFGLITLRQPIGNQPQRRLAGQPLGYWSKPGTRTLILPVAPASPGLRGKRVTISGYPGDKPDGQQWAGKGQVVSVTPAVGPELIYYSADSCAGHSGSPVWATRGDRICVIAIHTGPCIPGPDCRELGPSGCANTPTRRKTPSNRAVLITPTVWARVRGWMS